MGGIQRRSRVKKMNKVNHRLQKNKNYRRDIDQIHDDLNKAETPGEIETKVADETLPGFGLFYCISCARHFVSQIAIDVHIKTKSHKRRFKEAKEKPYSHEEAEECGKY